MATNQLLEAARHAARRYESVDPAITKTYFVETACADDGDTDAIHLLQINPNAVPSGILPVWLPPHPPSGFHHPIVLIEVTPDEFERLRRKELNLPDQWTFDPDAPI